MKIMLALSALPLLLMGGPALAVGDEPVHLNQRQAAAYYQSVRFLLDGDFRCPTGQTPVSGLITGGSHPMGGGSYATILFSKGARLKVDRMWEKLPKLHVTVKISCS